MISEQKSQQPIACAECDLLIEKKITSYGFKAFCPRCGNVLYQPKKNSVERTLALSITGLVLFIPANALPILTLKLFDQARDNTLFSGVMALYAEQMWITAILVLLFSMLIPLAKMLSMLYVCICLRYRYIPRSLIVVFKWYHRMDEWGMLEVYMLSIIVALVKLRDMAEVILGLGFYCFIALLAVTSLLSTMIDEEHFWELIEDGTNE